ncbi:MAG: hypothetical protein PHC95_08570 [Parabacteroides sp.]|nr:hypothetical protein [Parabacteroides sp.]
MSIKECQFNEYCYTPPEVYDAVLSWLLANTGIKDGRLYAHSIREVISCDLLLF